MIERTRYISTQRAIQAVLLVCLAAALLPVVVNLSGAQQLGWYLFLRQDLPVLPLLFVALIARPEVAAGQRRSPIAASPLLLPAVAIALIVACRAGHDLVFLDRDFSRDEQLVRFDGFILAHHRLSWPLPAMWRPFADALNRDYLLPVAGNVAWVSGYLPINAALQAIGGRWASPVLVAIGAVALWRIATRLWPGDAGARAVTLLLYALSAQIVLTGMTRFAMSGHLALDLVWLALFLRGGRAGHGGAIAIGFLATGLHQPIFHPLFVLPFLALLAHRRAWRPLGCYLAGYAAIGLFWLAWPHWLSLHAAGGVVMQGGAPIGIGETLAMLIAGIRPLDAVWLMALNVLRFATWQHLALLPLARFGIVATWRAEPLTRALSVGVALPVAVAAVLLPYQGHGWGYRYMHGVLGNLCLLGGIGWRAARVRGLALGRLLLWTSLASLLLLPVRGWMARRMVAPAAQVAAAIRASGAPVVLVADDAAPFAGDLVINRPDLAGPVILKRSRLDAAQIAALCWRFPTLRTIDPEALAPLRALYAAPWPALPPGPRCPRIEP